MDKYNAVLYTRKKMTTRRQIFHVVPNKNSKWDWEVKKEKVDTALLRSESKEKAIKFAKMLAKKSELGQVKIHLRTGVMQTEYTYGEDPEKYKS